MYEAKQKMSQCTCKADLIATENSMTHLTPLDHSNHKVTKEKKLWEREQTSFANFAFFGDKLCWTIFLGIKLGGTHSVE